MFYIRRLSLVNFRVIRRVYALQCADSHHRHFARATFRFIRCLNWKVIEKTENWATKTPKHRLFSFGSKTRWVVDSLYLGQTPNAHLEMTVRWSFAILIMNY
jgi:hypothetical protein